MTHEIPDIFNNMIDDRNKLIPDPEQEKYYPNNVPRPVKDGHYVTVKTTPFSNPVLIHYSKDMADLLGINNIETMIDYLSGNMDRVDGWATPYALSIYGTERVENCPYHNDTGYGDGRAISIGLFEIENIYELQLKGAGKTPFSRSGDGRATLRSSIREYLASEAMYYLGVPTTRALSLITSDTLIKRPSYKSYGGGMYIDKATIVCRVARSFYRIGHFELFSRRARAREEDDLLKLHNFTMHVIKRDYPEIYDTSLTVNEQILVFLGRVSANYAYLVSKWMGIGYVQSNMNSDNCSVRGVTLDYGPFGFMDIYDKDKNFWDGGGSHFSYKNQPVAMSINFKMLCNSVKPLLSLTYRNKVDTLASQFILMCNNRVNEEFKRKLGFKNIEWSSVENLFNRLEVLLQKTSMDWTIFWRELSWYPTQLLDNNTHTIVSACYDKNKYVLHVSEWHTWIADWLYLLEKEGRSSEEISYQMFNINPKYILREWMLSKAYTEAEGGEYGTIKDLYTLFLDPYDKTDTNGDKWYGLTPQELINKPGIGSMTCSS
jgi:uncharacterized protein YdiU (UPF0061 family)